MAVNPAIREWTENEGGVMEGSSSCVGSKGLVEERSEENQPSGSEEAGSSISDV